LVLCLLFANPTALLAAMDYGHSLMSPSSVKDVGRRVSVGPLAPRWENLDYPPIPQAK